VSKRTKSCKYILKLTLKINIFTLYSYKKYITNYLMNKNIALVLIVLSLKGCHSKSEIDKCVEATMREVCSNFFIQNEKKQNTSVVNDWFNKTFIQDDDFQKCISTQELITEGTIRQQCLRASAGKN
jgi:hypothetical protein